MINKAVYAKETFRGFKSGEEQLVFKRLPFILFILTILSLVFMIVVRTSVLGLRLLTLGSSGGRFLARSYNVSVFLFIGMLVVFAAVTLVLNILKKKRHESSAMARFSDEEEFESPAGGSDH